MTTEEQTAFDSLQKAYDETLKAWEMVRDKNAELISEISDLSEQLATANQTIETMLADRKNLTELLENAKLDVVTEKNQKDIYKAQFATQERKLEALSEQLKLRRSGKTSDELVQESEPKRGTAGML